MNLAVTTSRDSDNLDELAHSIADELAIPYILREQQSLPKLFSRYELDYLLVVENERVILHGHDGIFYWHPNMAVPRLKALRSGQKDQMVEAMGLKEGYSVLDCTLGLGADALVSAYAVGLSGAVTGLESSPIICYITKSGLENYQGDNKHLKRLIPRITISNCSYQEYLLSVPENSYDIVYFDPMFRHGQAKSTGLEGLRLMANQEPLGKDSLDVALRVARKRVVLKENCFSHEFQRLGASRVAGSKYSPIAYGIWDIC